MLKWQLPLCWTSNMNKIYDEKNEQSFSEMNVRFICIANDLGAGSIWYFRI